MLSECTYLALFTVLLLAPPVPVPPPTGMFCAELLLLTDPPLTPLTEFVELLTDVWLCVWYEFTEF